MALAERFGWTWDELFEQDMSLVLPAVAASNIYMALWRVYSWMNAAGQGRSVSLPNEEDLRIWQRVSEAQGKQNA